MSSDFSTALRVSASGLSAQRQRMNTISSNIANIKKTPWISADPDPNPGQALDTFSAKMPNTSGWRSQSMTRIDN